MIFLQRTLFFIIFLFGNSICLSQNAQKVADLIADLETKNLSKKERVQLLASIAYNHPELDQAIYYAKQSLTIAKEMNDLVLQAEAWEEIGAIEQRLGNKNNALESAFKALQLYDSLNLKEKQAASYVQIATHHILETEYDVGIDYLKKSQKIYEEVEDDINLTKTLINLGEAYYYSNQLNNAEETNTKALALSTSLKDKSISGYAIGNMGMVYRAQNRLLQAKRNLEEAINILKPLGDAYSVSIYISELGKVFEKEGNIALAETQFLSAFTMVEEAGLKEQIRDFSSLLTNFYETQNDYKKAFEFQKIYQQYQDSLVNRENIQKNEQIKADYEVSKRESEITLLNILNSNQKKWVLGLVVGLFILIAFAYLLYRVNQKVKKTNEILSDQKELISKREQEKALLLQELNHRVKNNLQMVASLLSLQSRELTNHPAQEAILSGKHRVEALSLVHRKLYQEGVDTKIPLKDYIQELVLGLFEGYNAKFAPSFSIADISIGIDVAIPLALIINEMVINSLKYAYDGIEEPLLKIVIMQETTEDLHLQVIDNGVGFTNADNEKTNSFGLKLISSLIEQLEGTMEQINTKGTHWELKIKLS
ncbi:putative sensor histidine kinase pdtaS [Kordia sp. SMS9]|uniref:sensor histidine kinase n=1 Tax=Kordia sp. SMS9 TaxID=2282170 RepID=UPI000E0D0C9A|nr:histidine kinase dimerization/phosphoacceptor domain -containing protein [Kordia sp. SMS9]AXG69868.1 putative sensor histidine kinase pdtaS [Kordia sp. SMS9]